MDQQTQAAVRSRIEEIGAGRPLYRRAVIDLEVLRSATSPTDYELRRRLLISGYSDLPISSEIMVRALDTQRRLAASSQHRGVSLPDLVIAACAEVQDAIVVHYEADYDRIAEVTGQSVEWVVPAGTVN